MLKRPRAPSPPLMLPTTPLLPPTCIVPRNSKRRRILPSTIEPIPQQDCNLTMHPHHEDSISNNIECRGLQELQYTTSHPDLAKDPYKLANSLLHELHVLQCHRLAFSPSRSEENLPWSHEVPRVMTLDRPHGAPEHPTARVSSDVRTFLPEAEVLYVTEQYEDTNRCRFCSTSSNLCLTHDHLFPRLLGQLFLSRKHQLDQPIIGVPSDS